MSSLEMRFPALLAPELAQLREDPRVLEEGTAPVAVYMRYSSERQSDQSIEGQLRGIRDYCARNGYRIVDIYVDRALSARAAEHRAQFQAMLRDASQRRWEHVIVYRLDRFARNRTDSAVAKAQLRRCGVTVLSAMEGISDQPEGIILESVLEGLAEYYSAELSQKIRRGMRESALKGQNLGGRTPLGYKLAGRQLAIDELTAPFVREAFRRYAAGASVAELVEDFNRRGWRTASGRSFSRSSFHRMFANERYIGIYRYDDIRLEGAVPALIEKDVWDAVQRRLSAVSDAPGRGKAKVEYLLSGKVFCGHCGARLIGDSGTGKQGATHNYYSCYTRRRHHTCDKAPIRQDVLEDAVLSEVVKLLTPERIRQLADEAVAAAEAEQQADDLIPQLRRRMAEVETSEANLIKALENGAISTALTERLSALSAEKETLAQRLEDAQRRHIKIDRDVVIWWLSRFMGGDLKDPEYRRRLAQTFVHAVTVSDLPSGPDGPDGPHRYRLAIAVSLTPDPPPIEVTVFGFGRASSTKRSKTELIIMSGAIFVAFFNKIRRP